MSNTTLSEEQVAIITALANDVVLTLEDNISESIEQVEDKIQFLVDAGVIETTDDLSLLRGVLHIAIDSIIDECEKADAQENEEEETERSY